MPPISASIRVAYLRCINRCCGCCPNRVRGNFDPAYQKARRMWLSTLHMAMRAARRNNKTDLFRLFERMYNENTSPDSMWMSETLFVCVLRYWPCHEMLLSQVCMSFVALRRPNPVTLTAIKPMTAWRSKCVPATHNGRQVPCQLPVAVPTSLNPLLQNTLLMEAEQHTEVASVVADKLTHGKLSEFIDVAVVSVGGCLVQC